MRNTEFPSRKVGPVGFHTISPPKSPNVMRKRARMHHDSGLGDSDEPDTVDLLEPEVKDVKQLSKRIVGEEEKSLGRSHSEYFDIGFPTYSDSIIKVTPLLCWITVALFMWEFFYYELWVQGLFVSSNGRVLSLCDSLYAMYRYRGLKPIVASPVDVRPSPPASPSSMGGLTSSEQPTDASGRDSLAGQDPTIETPRRRGGGVYSLRSKKNTTGRRVAIIFFAFICKYTGGTLVSLILGEWPTWLKGPRHVLSSLTCFLLLQVYPGDAIYRWIKKTRAAEAMLYAACGLYKLRKLVFIVNHPSISDSNWHYKVLAAFVAMECGSVMRRWDVHMTSRRFQKFMKSCVDPAQIKDNLCFLHDKWWPSLVAILLIGAGNKCWMCPHTTWSDSSGKDWTPIPVKSASFTSDGVLSTLEWSWALLIEHAFQPLAFLVLEFRFLRQLKWLSLS
eukprot:m.638471 g.638471  ORF g.638471 m.638471 type:complete len:447 (+) comp22606_c1_seq5:181-1521(+)